MYTSNDEYETFVTAHLEAAAECVLTKRKTKCRFLRESITVPEKRDMKKPSYLILVIIKVGDRGQG